MEQAVYRTLAPATRPRSPTLEPGPVSKRKRTTVACDICRERRTGCNGARPMCTACRKRDTRCTYVNQGNLEMRPTILKRENTELREKLVAFKDILVHLESMPEHIAQDTLQRLKGGADPTTLLKTVQGQQLNLLPSAQDTVRAMLPPIDSDCEFELLVRHPNAFPALDLSELSQSAGTTLGSPSVPWGLNLPPLIHSSNVQSSNTVTKFGRQDRHIERTASNISTVDTSDTIANRYFDPRLADLNIDFWTTVEITNLQAAEAISFYLETQHPIYGVFDAGLFVHDLISFSFEFCSPFLVSSLLAVASTCCAPLDVQISNQSYEFEKEAEKLFKSETDIDSLNTISGLCLLYLSLSMHGEGMRGLTYLQTAQREAERLKLFGVPEALETLGSLPQDKLRATSATAWGTFNLLVHMSRFYLTAPISYPPKLPLPGQTDEEHAYIDGVRSQVEICTEKLAQLDLSIATFSKFSVIMNNVFLVYRDQENKFGSLSFALSKYHRLLRLADNLPDTMQRKGSSENHALMLHIWLHLSIMDIFRPFIGPEEQHGSKRYLPTGASPINIFSASVKQLKALIFEYTYHIKPSDWNQFFPTAIIYAVNAVLNDRLDPKQRAYFFYYIHVGRSFRSLSSASTVNATMQALLAIAHAKGAITSAEAVTFTKEFSDDYFAKESKIRKVMNGWAVDMDVAASNKEAANADFLANKFEEITLFSEFTEGIV
ncbi:hypothetical protein T440DRAFT_415184 [Plenodomus tracheiphilus IPT5]|uniref:Zn(2)-C6 fungal-type domain-containing protein n=1 Tax=Plenodomus tracheiphilus IPT5 TaxID=1408161 RepID=A0A6A7BI33_9PLEO|nr:hypothetical protein T440DRAFT_415184 [Plenodomus tracheiphilus IPT5]